jgi:hypothetical protein
LIRREKIERVLLLLFFEEERDDPVIKSYLYNNLSLFSFLFFSRGFEWRLSGPSNPKESAVVAPIDDAANGRGASGV